MRALPAIPLLIWLYRSYGLDRSDHILLAVGIGGLMLIGLALAVVLAGALWLRVRKEDGTGAPLTFEAGYPFQTGYSLGYLHWIPLVKIQLDWEQPEGAKVELVARQGKLYEEVIAGERTHTAVIVRRLTVTDVFGLARFAVRRRMVQPLSIKPNAGQVNQFPLVPQNVTGDQMGHPEGKPGGDLIEMRPYVAGDPLKLVLWKVYARTGRMLVRQPEKALSPSQRTLAYLVAAEGDEPAAGIARAVLENGCLGNEYLFSAEGSEEPTRVVSEAVDQVVRSVNAQHRGGMGLDAFLAKGQSHGIQACILFVPSRPGEWLDRVLGQMGRHPGPFRAVIGVDGIQTAGQGRSLNKFLFRKEAVTGGRPEEIQQVGERLQAAGAEVLILDRLSGQASRLLDLPAAHLV
jgi:hypothetical protein